jgi:hypothetical protein
MRSGDGGGLMIRGGQSPSARRREREELLTEVGLVPRLRSHERTDRQAPVFITGDRGQFTAYTGWERADPDYQPSALPEWVGGATRVLCVIAAIFAVIEAVYQIALVIAPVVHG